MDYDAKDKNEYYEIEKEGKNQKSNETDFDKNEKIGKELLNYDANDKNENYKIRTEAKDSNSNKIENKEEVESSDKVETSKKENELDIKTKPDINSPNPRESEIVTKLKELFDVTEYKVT